MNIEYLGDSALIDDGVNVFTFETTDNPREFDSFKIGSDSLDWADNHYHLGKWRIFPYGMDNQLPKTIRDIVHKNYIAPGLMKKKTQWLWGKGPKLYTEGYDDEGKLVRQWMRDSEIEDWMEGWDAESYLKKSCVDFNHIEGVLTKFYLGLGSRIGRNNIAKLEHIQMDRGRLACEYDLLEVEPTHVVVTDWNFEMINSILNPKVYPLFDFKKPFQHRNAIYYSNMYSFCADYYTVPDIYGSLEWLRRSTAIPLILKSLSKNSLNIKYHVISPQKFWDDKEEQIKKNCDKKGVTYKHSKLVKYRDKFLREIAKVLSGEENTGKFWHSTKDFTVEGTNLIEHGWEIKKIDQNIKEFIESQIAISKRADHAVSSGIGIGSVLGNVSESGKSDSGSEKLYAMVEYLNTGIDIPEMIVCKAINYAIRANWPNKGLKVGFYHDPPQREEDKSSKNRVKNNAA